jgi:DNA invertase Pin-like site-specific DNA recombinase
MATPHNGKFVAYYRVSTQRQGQSGLGLEAQQQAVRTFLNGGKWDLIGEFTEIESGTRRKLKKRPMLESALELCRKQKATLVLAKLDRLARDVQFISTLLNSPVKFICADSPEADRTFLQMMAVFAEYEARKISERTTAALKAVKARGTKLGNPNPKPASEAGTAVLKQEADEFASRVMPIIRELQSRGATTLRDLAEGLSKRGVETPRGNAEWYPSQVSNLLKRGKRL